MTLTHVPYNILVISFENRMDETSFTGLFEKILSYDGADLVSHLDSVGTVLSSTTDECEWTRIGGLYARDIIEASDDSEL
mmetsp:Transcript_25949/g.38428  ORF Transcript_25949/g.38428 Transcript_25949/m.38428 type:complete len:80 (-) Transcript_25949:1537-1776(-)